VKTFDILDYGYSQTVVVEFVPNALQTFCEEPLNINHQKLQTIASKQLKNVLITYINTISFI